MPTNASALARLKATARRQVNTKRVLSGGREGERWLRAADVGVTRHLPARAGRLAIGRIRNGASEPSIAMRPAGPGRKRVELGNIPGSQDATAIQHRR